MKRDRPEEEGEILADKKYRGERGDDGGRGRGRGRAPRGRGLGRGPPRGSPGESGYGRHGDSWPVKLDSHGQIVIKAHVVLRREHAGAVIGRGGENVTTIRQETGASIHVNFADRVTGELVVEITGTWSQLADAGKRIMQIVVDNDPEWAKDTGGPVPKFRFHVLPEMVGSIIGKAGGNIKRIKEASGSNCKVDNLRAGEMYQQVAVYAPAKEAMSCFELLLESLSGFDPAKSKILQRQAASAPPQHDDYVGNWMGPDMYQDSHVDHGFMPPPAAPPMAPSMPPQQPPQQPQQPTVFQLPNGQTIQAGAGQAPIVLLQNPDGTYTQAQVILQAAQPGGNMPPGQPMMVPQTATAQPVTQVAAPQYATQGVVTMPAGSTQQPVQHQYLQLPTMQTMQAPQQQPQQPQLQQQQPQQQPQYITLPQQVSYATTAAVQQPQQQQHTTVQSPQQPTRVDTSHLSTGMMYAAAAGNSMNPQGMLVGQMGTAVQPQQQQQQQPQQQQQATQQQQQPTAVATSLYSMALPQQQLQAQQLQMPQQNTQHLMQAYSAQQALQMPQQQQQQVSPQLQQGGQQPQQQQQAQQYLQTAANMQPKVGTSMAMSPQ